MSAISPQNRFSVADLIPQRPPITMIDAFIGIDAYQTGIATLTVKNDCLFVQDNRLQESGLIEHIAQSAAARAGYLFRMTDAPVPLGFIGSIDKLTISRLPATGEQLTTSVTVISEVADVTMIQAQTKVGDEQLAGCRMKMFFKRD
ncbi:MAG: hydroxymyristoyl-ACP dehydratase [Prevotellaceae bacterium]|jgi:predicted hotdog family 3-hydroxylacyl-ACP dehydratase|nr:hydroxymyristoyl-ACP dehydratase [Prevotellaceae bacterium]